jgi:hypothetical protein
VRCDWNAGSLLGPLIRHTCHLSLRSVGQSVTTTTTRTSKTFTTIVEDLKFYCSYNFSIFLPRKGILAFVPAITAHGDMSIDVLTQMPARTHESNTRQYTIGSIDEVCMQASGSLQRSESASVVLKKRLPTSNFGGEQESSAFSRTATGIAGEGMNRINSEESAHSSRSSIDTSISKTKVPEFRQSRRWAKAHEIPTTPRPSTSLVIEDSHPQTSTSENAARRSLDSAPSLQGSPNSSHGSSLVQNKFCGCVTLPDWQIFRQVRLHRQNTPTSPKSQTTKVRRQKSLELLAAKAQSAPRRIALLRRVRSRGRMDYAQAIKHLQSIIGMKTCETIPETHETGVRHEVTSSKQNRAPNDRVSLISTDFWNSPRRSKRWSNDCRAMLRGEQLVDFDNEWRPEPFSAEVEFAKPNNQYAGMDGKTEIDNPSTDLSSGLSTKTKSAPASSGPIPPERISSKGISVARAAQVKKWGRQPVMVNVRDMVNEDQHDHNKSIGKCSSKLQQQIRRVPSPATTISRMSNRNLKNAKSIDSMAQIEAHLQSPIDIESSMINSRRARAVYKIRSRTSLSVSPQKTRTPAGKPPERPLPDLPDIKFDSKNRGDSRLTSRAGSRSPKKVSGVKKEINSVSVKDLGTSGQPYTRLKTCCDIEVPAQLPVALISTDATATNFNSHPTTNVHGTLRPPMLKVKHLVTERSDKVHELKKKHVVALNKQPKTMEQDKEQDYQRPVASMNRVSSIYEVLPSPPLNSPPPLPLSGREYPGTHHTGVKMNRFEFSDDEYSVFPAPPVSRPASCESTSASARSARNNAQSGRTSLSLRQSGPKSISQSDARPTSRQGKTPKNKPKQMLSQSTIMIVCDTDPATENFRAGAKSPIHSIASPASRSNTPRNQVYRSANGRTGSPFANSELVNIDELADFGTSRSPSKKRSLRSVRSLANLPRNPTSNVGKQSPGYISPLSSRSQTEQKHAKYPIFESDSEQEDDIPTRAMSPVIGPPRSSSIRADSRVSTRSKTGQRRKPKANVDESEIYMEEMMRVIARYAGKGNKLAKQMMDQSAFLTEADTPPGQLAPIRSMKSPRRANGPFLVDASEARANIGRRIISDKPVHSAPGGTDTDDSGNTIPSDSNRDSYKLTSDGLSTKTHPPNRQRRRHHFLHEWNRARHHLKQPLRLRVLCRRSRRQFFNSELRKSIL